MFDIVNKDGIPCIVNPQSCMDGNQGREGGGGGGGGESTNIEIIQTLN